MNEIEVKLTATLLVIDTLLQDVAEDPTRLTRAMEIARRDVPGALALDLEHGPTLVEEIVELREMWKKGKAAKTLDG